MTCLALVLLVGGCQKMAPPALPAAVSGRPALEEQIAAVRSGGSTKIKIEGAIITDDDLQLLADLAPLESLVLQVPTEISDAGLAHLAGLMNLKTLNLKNSTVTDEGLAALAGLPRLELLRLGSSQVRGPGLRHIAELAELRHLILQKAPLADAGLAHLHGLGKLESLYVEETETTPEGLRALQKALPNLSHVHPHY
ncbi:MAG: hypothetical protein AB7O62_02065 [Pirellulales bacterium]